MIIFIKYNISSVEEVIVVIEVFCCFEHSVVAQSKSELVINPGAINCPGGMNAACAMDTSAKAEIASFNGEIDITDSFVKVDENIITSKLILLSTI